MLDSTAETVECCKIYIIGQIIPNIDNTFTEVCRIRQSPCHLSSYLMSSDLISTDLVSTELSGGERPSSPWL